MMAKLGLLCYFFLIFFFKKILQLEHSGAICDAGMLKLYLNKVRSSVETWQYGGSPKVKDYLRCIIIEIIEKIFFSSISNN